MTLIRSCGLLQAHEGHLGAVDVGLRALHELVDVLVVPDRLLGREGLHAVGIGEARMAAGLAADHAPEVRAGAVGAAVVGVVAGLALGEDGLAGGDVGGRQHRAPVGRNVRRRRRRRRRLRRRDLIARLLPAPFLAEDAAGELHEARRWPGRRQHGAGDLVEGQVAHCPEIGPLYDRRGRPAKARESRPLLRPALLHATGAGATGQSGQPARRPAGFP